MSHNHQTTTELKAELEQAHQRIAQLEALLQLKSHATPNHHDNNETHSQPVEQLSAPQFHTPLSQQLNQYHDGSISQSDIGFRTLVNAMDDIVFLLDREQRYVGVYGQWLEKTGLSPEMFLGKTVRALLEPEVAMIHEAANRQALTGEHVLYEWVITGRKRKRFFQTSLSPLYNEAGEVIGIVGVGRDITPLKQAEAALYRSEIRYKNLVEKSPDIIYIYSVRRGSLYYSPRVEAVLGYSAQYLIDCPHLWCDLIHPTDKPKVYQFINNLKNEAGQKVEYRIRDAQGQEHWLLDRSISKYEEDGDIIVEGLATDITERKQIEQALQESEEKFRNFIEQTSEGIIVVDEDGRINTWNQGAEQMTGLSREKVVGLYFWDIQYQLLPADQQHQTRYDQLKSIVSQALDTGEAPWLNRLLETRFAHLDGSERVIQQRVFSIKTNMGLWLGSVSRDITARVKTEKTLKESEAQLKLVLQGAELGFWDWEIPTGRNVFNQQWAEMLGYAPQEITPHISQWQNLIHPDDLEQVMTVLHDHLEGQRDFYEAEYRLRTKAGDWLWVLDRGKVLKRDEAGKPLRAVGIHQDITLRKQIEEQTRSSLAEKEVLLKEIHHRVKNNLQIITSLLNLQSRRTQDAHAFSALQESNNRMYTMALIHEKLYRSDNLARVDFVVYVQELTTHLCHSYQAYHRGVTIVVEGDEIYLDINQLVPCGLIINELVTNALKYAFTNSHPGQLSIEIRAESQNECQLVIADNGVGLPANFDITQISSLGLQLVSSLTAQLSGSLVIQQAAGTTFIIRFPRPMD